MEAEKFDLWCVVELFGHSQIAGKCTEQNIAGSNMLRVDVPATSKNGEFTKFYGSSAIYAINPVDEITARAKAESLNIMPVQVWNIQSYLDKQQVANQLPHFADKATEDDDYDDDEKFPHPY